MGNRARKGHAPMGSLVEIAHREVRARDIEFYEIQNLGNPLSRGVDGVSKKPQEWHGNIFGHSEGGK